MKSFYFTHLLIFTLLALGAGCNLANLAGDKNISAARSESDAPKTGAGDASGAADRTEEKDTNDIEGTYNLNNHRKGADGYENTLTVEKPENGKMRVSFEGTFFYQANGAETFHESSAYGTLTVNGNVAKGNLTEEGSDNGCRVELNFTADERVNLKSSDCDLNVTPDGVYQKGAEDKSKNLDADVSKQDEKIDDAGVKADEYYDPFIQYDDAGTPVALVNLLERKGERADCGEEVKTFTGKVLTVVSEGDFDFEFTLADGNRKRQKISLLVSPDDKLPYDDLRSLIKTGNNLEVRFIYCGNGGYATPTAVYKQ